MFLKTSAIESANFFLKWKRGISCLVLKCFLANLFGNKFLPEILQISFTVKNSGNIVKSGFFKRKELSDRERQFFSKGKSELRSLV